MPPSLGLVKRSRGGQSPPVSASLAIRGRARLGIVGAGLAAVAQACVFTPPPPLPGEEPSAVVSPSADPSPTDSDGAEAGDGEPAPAASTLVHPEDLQAVLESNKAAGDPVDGIFALEAALEGLGGEGTGTLLHST